ncbi:MAG: hypothetical protein E7378_00125 [Clostridiales bacterium]|nr:hypothetical protein [Clostridiales bacterium]
MKIIMVILLVALCGAIGYGLSKNYSDRKKFFYCLESFFVVFKVDISFNKSKLLTALNAELKTVKNKNLTMLLTNFTSLLTQNGQLNKNEVFKGINILYEQEKDVIFAFLQGLGKSDVFNQVQTIDNFLFKVREFYDVSNKDCKKYCPLYVKLSIIFGLLIAIIFI